LYSFVQVIIICIEQNTNKKINSVEKKREDKEDQHSKQLRMIDDKGDNWLCATI